MLPLRPTYMPMQTEIPTDILMKTQPIMGGSKWTIVVQKEKKKTSPPMKQEYYSGHGRLDGRASIVRFGHRDSPVTRSPRWRTQASLISNLQVNSGGGRKPLSLGCNPNAPIKRWSTIEWLGASITNSRVKVKKRVEDGSAGGRRIHRRRR